MDNVTLKNGCVFFDDYQKTHPNDKGIKYCGRCRSIWESFLKFLHLGKGTIDYQTANKGNLKLKKSSSIEWLLNGNSDKKAKKELSKLDGKDLIQKIQTVAATAKVEDNSRGSLLPNSEKPVYNPPSVPNAPNGTTPVPAGQKAQPGTSTSARQQAQPKRQSINSIISNLPPPDLSDVIPDNCTRSFIERENAQLKLQAEQGMTDSQYRYAEKWDNATRELKNRGLDYSEHYKETLKWLKMVEDKHPVAPINLGGIIFDINDNLLEGAIESKAVYDRHLDNADVLFFLGDLHEFMSNPEVLASLSKADADKAKKIFSYAQAKKHYIAAAKKGSDKANDNLGNLKDITLKTAIESKEVYEGYPDDAEVLFFLGKLHEHMSNSEVQSSMTKEDAEKAKGIFSYALAKENYIKASTKGCARAQYLVGTFYYDGSKKFNILQSTDLAIELMTKAAKQGEAGAIVHLGMIENKKALSPN